METIKDYQVRVWGDDVFILSDNINYWGHKNNENLQCNYLEGTAEYDNILKICNDIKDKMLKLNELLKEEN